MPTPPPYDPYPARRRVLRGTLTRAGVDALLITHPVDIRYLTGFCGEDSWAMIPATGRGVVILTDARFEIEVGRSAPGIRAVIRKHPLAQELAQVVAKRGYERVAVAPEHVSMATRKTLAKHLRGRKIVPIDDGLARQRSIKDAGELKLIRRAIRIQQQAFTQTLAEIEPGMTELEVCALLEYQMKVLGAQGPAFETIVAVGANAALPHAVPGRTKLKAGGLLLIDWGATVGGYRSDMTRTVALGSMKPKLREIYSVVLEAFEAGVAAIGPGVALADVDATARRVIERAGYGPQFGHSLGHGIGLEVHEAPGLSAQSRGVLEAGQIVTVEPGIYLPGLGGVRIEDDVRVTERGRQVLCNLPRSLESAII